MADDAGALLVRSGLVSSTALDDARARVAELGGTVGEHLVANGVLADDVLTDFYKQRMLVPQVNPNTLARLAAKVVALIPNEMAIALRAVPVSLDADNNLTVAMSDPSNRHAVDEIAYLTGAYVVRAVATQMQIAWCLAHYYGYISPLGQRLLQPNAASGQSAAPRVTSPTAQRVAQAAVRPTLRRATPPAVPTSAEPAPTPPEPATSAALPNDTQPMQRIVGDPPRAARVTPPPIPVVAAPAPAEVADAVSDGVPRPTGRAVSGEIRVAHPRAASIKPPIPTDDDDVPELELEPEPSAPIISIESSAPIISIEVEEPDQTKAPTTPMPVPKRKRPAEPDPPELAARAGEVELGSRPIRALPLDEPRVVIADELDPPIPPPMPEVHASGELSIRVADERPIGDHVKIEVSEEIVDGPSAAVVIHEHLVQESEPVLLERRRATGPNEVTSPRVAIAPAPDDDVVDEADDEVVELAHKKIATRGRTERRTELGIGIVPAVTAPRDDTAPHELEDQPTASVIVLIDVDKTRLDTPVAPPAGESTSEEVLAAPPSPVHDETGPVLAPPPLRSSTPVPPPSGKVSLDNVQRRTPRYDDDEEDDGRDARGGDTDVGALYPAVRSPGSVTSVMTAAELDRVIPEREESVDDGWGMPGTTIPPPLLGAIPGSLEPHSSGVIPIPNIDSEPLIVAPPVAPVATRGSTPVMTPARALEEATARVFDLIRALEHTDDRDDVVALMTEHLAATHQRAGFFAVRAGELSLFMVAPKPTAISPRTLRLDRPSTLQDIVGTRLPYRGPMNDDASRAFLVATLGESPSELLLVPISVRERVVGILFGDQPTRHTFDDQLALAARAAGVALERILKDRRGR